MPKTLATQIHRRLAADELVMPPGETPTGSRGVILSAALTLFAEHGFGGTSVRDIAAAAGVQPATMYAHYPSKQHVLAEIVRIGHEQHYKRLRAALLDSSADPAEQLAAVVRAHVLAHADYQMLAVVANTELHALAPEFAAASLELRKQGEQFLLDVLQRGISQGAFKIDNPWLAVAAIGAMGIRVAHWFTPSSPVSAAEVAETYAQFALRIVGAAPGGKKQVKR
jgi:AcrR family transcriptional regulator